MKKIHSAFAPFLGILLLLAVWFLLCRAEIFSPYLLPTPQKVFDSFLRMLFSGELLRDVLISFIRILKGFCIAFLLAFLLGMFRTLLPAAEKYYDAVFPQCTAAESDSASDSLVRHRGNHKNRYYRAGILLPDVSEHRKRLYGL